MSLEIHDIEQDTRDRALIFSLSTLQQLLWVAEHCDAFALFTELERFIHDATTPQAIPLPAIAMPKRHMRNYCKTFIFAQRVTSGNRVLFFEPGNHGAFCTLAKTIDGAIKSYRYYQWTRRQATYPNRAATLDRRFHRAASSLSHVRHELRRLFDMVITTVTSPDAPDVTVFTSI